MGGKDPNRQPKLGSVKVTPAGWIWFAICNNCGHRGVLPSESLIRKHGELILLEFAMNSVRCTVCRQWGAAARLERLCDPGCPHRRWPARMAAE